MQKVNALFNYMIGVQGHAVGGGRSYDSVKTGITGKLDTLKAGILCAKSLNHLISLLIIIVFQISLGGIRCFLQDLL